MSTMNNRSEIEWAPRVSLSKIRELYVREARGDCDDELIDEVSYSLYARCLSILEFTAACEGEVRCKRCAAAGQETILLRKTKKPAEILRCPACGWQVRWRVYLAESEKVDGQLHAGHAREAFQRYASRYPHCHSCEEKILAIDRLVHEFHWILLGEKGPRAHKPAGVNLLRGSTTQVLDTLNELTYGENTPAGLLSGRDWWRAQEPVAKRWYAPPG
jgi:hypothetical protein